MKRIIGAFLVCILSLGCQSKSSTPAATARINIKDEPQTLDPRKARQLGGQAIVHMLFDGLMRQGREGNLECALAERVEVSEDGKSYTFHLKESYWSNAERISSYDFAHAWKKVLSPEFPSDLGFLFYPIKNAKLAKTGEVPLTEVGIVCLDDNTLLVELEHPCPNFLELTALPSFAPVNAKLDQEQPGWATEAASYVSCGPFLLTSWEHQSSCRLTKNPLYWDAKNVELQQIELEMVPEETELKLFEQKSLDWIGSPITKIPAEEIPFLRDAGSLQTQEILGTVFLRLNTKQTPLANHKIRQALGLCVNRAALVEHVVQGEQKIATGLIPEICHLARPTYFKDADGARGIHLFNEGLKELGLTRESLPEITYLYRNSSINHLIAQTLQQQWRSLLGIEVKLEAVEGKVFFDRVSKMNYDIAYGDWLADVPDPLNFLEVFKYNKGSNNTGWENANYTALLDRISQEADVSKREKLFVQAEEMLIKEMPIIPLYHHNMLYVTNPRLKNVAISPMGQIDFKWATTKDVR